MRRTKEEAEQTKQAILDAAVDVFTEYGVAKATLERIAKAANVTRGAVYWHFKNKLEIFDALQESLHSAFIQRILEGLEVEHPNPVGQLQQLCTQLLIEIDQDEHKRKALTLFMLKCDYSGDLVASKQKIDARKADTLKAFRRYFEKAIENGSIAESANPAVLTMAINCFMRGILIEYLDTPNSMNLQQDVPALMAFFFSDLPHHCRS